MTTVLMIDDDTSVTATVKEYFDQHAPGTTFVAESDFTKALERLREVRPDILILDVYQGNPATGNIAAQPVWQNLWGAWFCPLVFYSAGEVDVDPPPPEGHPFISQVSKGAGTEQQVLNAIKGYASHVAAIRSVEQEIGAVTHSVLRDVAPHVFEVETDDNRRREMLVRTARRRVAAMMDDALLGTKDLMHPWEQYIHPPLAGHLLLGDILRLTASATNDPSAYRLVLTPTCDLVPYGEPPQCKVEAVLTVRASDPKLFVTKGLTLDVNIAERKLKERLASALNDPHQLGVSVLPECPGVVPLLALDFRNLELIPMSDIGLNSDAGKRLVRVASIDSPFREFIAWAFLQINCRPGIPPRNMQSVVDAVVASCKPPVATGGTA